MEFKDLQILHKIKSKVTSTLPINPTSSEIFRVSVIQTVHYTLNQYRRELIYIWIIREYFKLLQQQ